MGYINKLNVLASATDYTARVGVVGAISYLQDNMCDYFKCLGCDGISMIPKCNAFFVITKTKIKFYKFPKWGDEIKLKTTVMDHSKIRVNLSNSILYFDDKICVEGIQELCAIDSETRRIRSVESTLFPIGIEKENDNNFLEFDKLNFDKNDFNFVKKININLSNVDFYLHTNNVEYVKFCMSVLDHGEIKNKEIDTFEIHYLKETKMGDEVEIYIRNNEEKIDFIMVNNDIIVTKAQMCFVSSDI